MELIKSCYNQAKDPHLYFYRDVSGKEVDILFQQGSTLVPIEIKSNKTFSDSFLNGLKYFHKQAPKRAKDGVVIYGGEKSQKIKDFQLLSAEKCFMLFDTI